MPTILKTKNSVTTTVVPTTLQQGELAVNITDKKLWVGNAATTPVQLLGAGVTGDVVGPASATDNAVARFDGTTGKIIQNSAVTIADTTGDITTAGYLITAAGAVGTPALTTTGDTNTGIFFPAADTIAFTEGGVESMRIASNGNVAIGTTNASRKLVVNGGSSDAYIQTTTTATTSAGAAGIMFQTGSSNFDYSNMIVVAGGTNAMQFWTADSERMRIDSAGNVGIGNTNPNAKFHVSSTGTTANIQSTSGEVYLRLTAPSATGGYIGYGIGATETMTFFTNAAEQMRIDSSGNVGVGVTPSAWATTIGLKAIQVSTTGCLYNYAFGGNNFTSVTDNSFLDINGSPTYITTNTASQYVQTAASHRWSTAASGTAGTGITFSERMRITSSGNVSIGTTSSGGKLTVNDGNINVNWGGGFFTSLDRGITVLAGGYNDTTNKARVVQIGGVGDNNNRCGWTSYSIKTNGVNNGAEYYIRPVIWDGSAFTEQGSAGVYLQDNATSWSSASDERLKENLEPIADAVIKVNSIRAVTGKYKTDTQGTSRAFLIAQDVQKVLPEAVNENSEGYLGLAYTDTIPLLVAAIQEQQTLINNLTTRLNALEGK